MKHTTVLFLSFGIPALCFATTLAPYAGQCRLLDQILASTATKPQTNVVALHLFERVALGRTGEISAESEVQVGVMPGQLREKDFSAPTVRACAFRKIGEIGLPEALEFLANLKRADLGPDMTQEVWPASQIALQNARLNRISEPHLQVEFLEVLANPQDGRGATASWAVNELCDRGAATSMTIVQRSIRSRLNGQRDEDEIRYCLARMEVVSRHPDRIKALGSVLTVENITEDDRLIRWAMYRLDAMRTPNADAELIRFKTEIEKLPNASAARRRLNGFSQEIDHVRVARPK